MQHVLVSTNEFQKPGVPTLFLTETKGSSVVPGGTTKGALAARDLEPDRLTFAVRRDAPPSGEEIEEYHASS
jgi:hypothetical protein